MTYELVTGPMAVPNRPEAANKGTFGRALIIAGSAGMSGAAALAGISALRGGAGLVTLAIPFAIQNLVASIEPSYMTVGLPCSGDGRLSAKALRFLPDLLRPASAIACGPGWGQTDDLLAILNWLNTNTQQPLLIDADGLNLLARDPGQLARAAGPRILTPHPGEFARLTGLQIDAIQAQRIETAVNFAQQHDVLLLLKGAGTVVTDGRRVAVNTTGNSGMATGGCGDVLTGLITSLLAQGMEPFDAARLGAYLHGLAGDLAAAELSQPGLIASDLPRYLGKAWLALGSHRPPAGD